MGKVKLTKIIASSLIAVSVLALNPIGASAEWRKDNTGWWYSEGDDSWAIGWRNIDGKYYNFDYSGYMQSNTIVDGNTLDASGAVIKTGVGTLSREDFNFEGTDTTNSLKGYKNIIDWFYANDYVKGWGCYLSQKDSEYGKDKSQTSKGIKIGSSLSEVLAAYGNTEIKNVTSGDMLYMYGDWKSNPEKKCVTYSYYEGITRFNIRFYFDASDKLVVIAYTVNESTFPQGIDQAQQLTNQYRAKIKTLSK
ncbi:hypothetical protein CBE01nite_22720 [Clostridium beijerinckii]|uniref:Cell wall-binding protein n=2 Tax=Clostridiaceae TaxID=31979 RepID=A0AB74VAN0_CLOBE|nr:hypothetical protein [Clostridium beijerinckii]NRZ27698.1 hypothetical protein [Clostridium beijerinckii]NYB96518.1 hypothetical protein [Clostridium beijerinckii]OOM25048.1 hypothetical protein CLBEI_17320 [Clostridium beijerinckii]QUN33494.1 hypothetical protein KEC93_16140 [Clostridium beijerinckii]SQB01279.1 cell wall binding repeat domain protein [Clostridium beijerinckii]